MNSASDLPEVVKSWASLGQTFLRFLFCSLLLVCSSRLLTLFLEGDIVCMGPSRLASLFLDTSRSILCSVTDPFVPLLASEAQSRNGCHLYGICQDISVKAMLYTCRVKAVPYVGRVSPPDNGSLQVSDVNVKEAFVHVIFTRISVIFRLVKTGASMPHQQHFVQKNQYICTND